MSLSILEQEIDVHWNIEPFHQKESNHYLLGEKRGHFVYGQIIFGK